VRNYTVIEIPTAEYVESNDNTRESGRKQRKHVAAEMVAIARIAAAPPLAASGGRNDYILLA